MHKQLSTIMNINTSRRPRLPRHIIINGSLLALGAIIGGLGGLTGLNGVATPSNAPGESAPLAPARPDASTAQSKAAAAPPATTPDAAPTAKPAAPSVPTAPATYNARADSRQADAVVTADGSRYPLVRYQAQTLPNDPLANQWWVSPNGMDSAWNLPAGVSASRIAIIDTGYALEHEDLASRWSVNQAESGPTTEEAAAPNCTSRSLALDKACNNIDDDGNGYTDDYRGWDFTANDNQPQAGSTNPDGDGTTHGTSTAGIAAAAYGNGRGLAGISRHAQLVPLQALDDDGYGDTFTVGQAVYYAADLGVDVISISLGATSPDMYLRQAILYAMGRGAIVVASSGNEGCDCLTYPAYYPEVVAVGASTPSGSRASFSNYGAGLDLLAPGQAMTSTYWTKLNGVNAYASSLSGTSYAAPFVSGLLAEARSYQPDANWEDLLNVLMEASDRSGMTAELPRSVFSGYGRASALPMLERSRTSVSEAVRYQQSAGFIGAAQAKQCQAGSLPATTIYRLSKGPEQRLTASTYQRALHYLNGWSVTELLRSCSYLPGDSAGQVRSLNLGQELMVSDTKR